MSTSPTSLSSFQQADAKNFIQAIKQISPNGPRKYVYLYNHNLSAASFTPDNVTDGYTKMSIGFLSAMAEVGAKEFYAKHEIEQLKTGLLEVQHRLEEKRSGNALKRTWIVFLSSLYNLYQGLGLKDSLTLINQALVVTQHQLDQPVLDANYHITTKGAIDFSAEDQQFLLEVCAKKNIRSLADGCDMLNINGKQVKVMHDPTNRKNIELDKFPGIIFKFVFNYNDNNVGYLKYRNIDIVLNCNDNDIDYWKWIYHNINTARAVCETDKLDRLVVPEASLIYVSHGSRDNYVLAVRKATAAPSEPEAKLSREEHEKQLQEFVRQLTVFICKTKLSDITRHKLPLQENKKRGLHLVLKEDFFSQMGGESIKGLLKFGEGHPHTARAGLMGLYPQYAHLIQETVRLNLSSKQYQEIQEELTRACEKAARIVQTKINQEGVYRSKSIGKDSPAIPVSILDELKTDDANKKIWETIIEDINAVIKRQSAEEFDLVYARQWRLTNDAVTADSNYKLNIYEHRSFIEKQMLPKLRELGYVYNIFNAQQAQEQDIDLRKIAQGNDLIVQF